MKRRLVAIVLGLCLLAGCSNKKPANHNMNQVVSKKEVKHRSKDEEVTKSKFSASKPGIIEPEKMTPQELFYAFLDGYLPANDITDEEERTWDFENIDMVLVKEDGTIVRGDALEPQEYYGVDNTMEICNPIDLDNDGELEFILSTAMAGDICFDCKDGKITCFASGRGTAGYCYYTHYKGACWIVHSDVMHTGRSTYWLDRYNKDLKIVESFKMGWEDWDDDGVKRYYKDNRTITESEYEKLYKEVFPKDN